MAYRSSLLYRNPGHYQPGVFDLPYRNARAYRNEARYRLGIDDPVGDTGSGVDTQTLSVLLTPSDTGSGAEGTYPAISVTLEGGGPVLEWVTGITETHLLSVGSADTGSGTETEISGISATSAETGTGVDAHGISLSQSETGTTLDTLLSIAAAITQTETGSGSDSTIPGVALSATDTAYVSTGGMGYRSNEDYQTSGNYRQLGEQTGVEISVEELATFLEALGDRTLSVEDLMDLAEDTGGAIGTVAGPLSLRLDLRYRTNRAGRFPGRMRSRR